MVVTSTLIKHVQSSPPQNVHSLFFVAFISSFPFSLARIFHYLYCERLATIEEISPLGDKFDIKLTNPLIQTHYHFHFQILKYKNPLSHTRYQTS